MKNTAKTWLIIAVSLVLIGGTVFISVMSKLGWDFSKLSTSKFETNYYKIQEDYQNISIITDTADIVFVPSENAVGEVVCYEQENKKHSVIVQNGTLTIKINDTRKWYEHIGLNFSTPKITVSIPHGEYRTLSIISSTGDVNIPRQFKFECIDISESTGTVTNFASTSTLLKIKTSTGNIRVENISAAEVDLSVSTGNVNVSNVTCEGNVKINVSTGKATISDTICQNIISSGNTGDISLKNVISGEMITVERSTGDVKLNSCDATEIYIKTDTGDVCGSLLSEKLFITQTDTGRIDVPEDATGGKCKIITSTGNIRIEIE